MAAPFVRLLGLNGFLVLHVLLLFGVCVCGYKFLAAQSAPAPALIFTLAFVGATCVPVYAVFLAPEILHFAMIFFAYFLWLYKEVKPDAPAWLRGRGSDIAAAMLLGAATYSKPPNHALLVAPLVLLAVVAAQVARRLAGRRGQRRGGVRPLRPDGDERGGVQLPGRRSQDVLHIVSVRRLEGQRVGPQRHGDEHERLGFRQRAAGLHRTGSRTTSSTSWSAGISASCRISFPARWRSRCGCFSRERRRPWRVLIFSAVVGSAVGSADPGALLLERRRRTDRQPLHHRRLRRDLLPRRRR